MSRHEAQTIADTGALALAAVGVGACVAMRAVKSSRYDFAGKAVLITGGSRGLGIVPARQLAHDGARLMLLARDEQELQQAAAADPFRRLAAGAGRSNMGATTSPAV